MCTDFNHLYVNFFTETFLKVAESCSASPSSDPESIGQCIADPEGEFMIKHAECIAGQLTEREMDWSENILRTWTNLAIHGYLCI